MTPMFSNIDHYDEFFDDHVPADGEVFKLGQNEESAYVEFLNSSGRLGLRIMTRHGQGVLLTEEQLVNLSKLVRNFFEDRDDV